MRRTILMIAAGCFLVTAVPNLSAQRGGRGRGGTPPSPRENAAIDLTGNWVSVVTEDWRYRMVVPPAGEYLGVPLNGAGRQVADSWDPDADATSGEACRPFGAAGVMRIPGRVEVDWADDETLRIRTDAGVQTRLFHFGAPDDSGARTWQGVSEAEWILASGVGAPGRIGHLKVVTTDMRPGYLRLNGVPYSADAELTEFYDRVEGPAGEDFLIVTTEVVDPAYLTTPFVTSTHFRKEADGSGFSPAPCE